MSIKFDKCVICGQDSPYPIDYPIDLRIGYVEGGGQGCFEPNNDQCPHRHKEKMIMVPESVFTNHPNNMELANIVRKIYNEQK